MLSVESLRKAFQPICGLGLKEEEFDVEGLHVVIIPLVPDQEVEVQRWAASAVEGDDDNASGILYLDRFKTGCLSHSLVQIGDQNLRGLDYIETGEVLPNGVAVKVAKHLALRDVLKTFARPLLDAIFRKFGEMMERQEIEVSQLIEFEPVDLDAEISRLQGRIDRLEDLRLAREKNQIKTPGHVAALQTVGLVGSEEPKAEPKAETSFSEDTPTAETGGRRPILPVTGSPLPPEPTKSTLPEDFEHPAAESLENRSGSGWVRGPSSEGIKSGEDPQPQEPVDEVITARGGNIGPPPLNEGWVDSGDSEGLANAAAAETERLQKMRSRRAGPPHQGAYDASNTQDKKSPVKVFDPSSASHPNQPEESEESTDGRNPKFVPPKR